MCQQLTHPLFDIWEKVIAQSGVASRRKAEELILAKKVKVNGDIVSELGVKVSEKDIIEVNGTRLNREEKVYYLLNKPRGVITSTSDDKGRATVISLINEENSNSVTFFFSPELYAFNISSSI